MAKASPISWCDNTFNPWIGCTKVSPACAHCYAERDFDHRYQKVKWGPSGTRVITGDANWRNPLKWNKDAAASGVRKRVFCASLADVFEDWTGPIVDSQGCVQCFHPSEPNRFVPIIPEFQPLEEGFKLVSMNDVRARLFRLIDATPNLDWLLLTKRPENIRDMWDRSNSRSKTTDSDSFCNRENVWLGTSVENQKYADIRIPQLLACQYLSPVLFLSCEPLLGPVDLKNITNDNWNVDSLNGYWTTDQQIGIDSFEMGQCEQGPTINWIIAGGESGPEARPTHPEWFRALRDQAASANIPFHFKQWGEYRPANDSIGDDMFSQDVTTAWPNGTLGSGDQSTHGGLGHAMLRVGVKKAGRTLDGIIHDSFPLTNN